MKVRVNNVKGLAKKKKIDTSVVDSYATESSDKRKEGTIEALNSIRQHSPF